MSSRLSYHDLLQVFKEAHEIYTSSISWEAKFDLIFSERISQRTSFEWYDPDTGYEEDVSAFMDKFYEYMGRELGEQR